MSKEIYYDVVVVGAGPAGTSTAISLVKNGVKVVIVDRAIFPRNKLCGGLITPKSLKVIEGQLGILDIRENIQHETNGFEIYYRDRLLNRAYSKNKLYFISRKVLDERLLNKARQLGCSVVVGENITIITNDYIVVGQTKIYYRKLVGADGVNSEIRKIMGKRLKKRNVGFGVQIEVPFEYCKLERFLPKIFLGYIKYGWAWVFPKKKCFSIGLGGISRDKHTLISSFYSFVSDLGINLSWAKSKIRGAYIPYGAYLSRPAQNRFFLTGDAAGFVEPITGEGIYFALLSGIFAAESICLSMNKSEEIYNLKCTKRIISPIRQALLARPLLFINPFKMIAVKLFSRSTKYMERYMEILAGNIDYKEFFFKNI